ncbi:hypothetical protein [Tunicatimonas pelagia]|uniref:hypothetical protein n=1 Tax=Tunicatimonas pelagia TaxID=931531 RepID=UPI002666AF7D|nr:hypothetical protein [Tunicatimonas pelagia]WKN43065.1 hypothetical protein P0M28_28920 [Tunicatimonas pelagia]
MKKCMVLTFCSLLSWLGYSQSEDDQAATSLREQIFLPALEIGYLYNGAQSLSGGLLVKTSIEYRLKNNNDVFFRLNYDTYDTKYKLENINGLTNIINGTAFFWT